MKKLIFIVVLLAGLVSCGVRKSLIPRAVNTINTTSLRDLNLQRGDYEILNTVTAEATICYTINKTRTSIVITDADGEFSLHYVRSKKKGWTCKYHGILKYGYMQNDYAGELPDVVQPEEVARRLAVYRLVNVAQQYGADGLVEPTIATNVEQIGEDVFFKSTATAKIVKIKTDR